MGEYVRAGDLDICRGRSAAVAVLIADQASVDGGAQPTDAAAGSPPGWRGRMSHRWCGLSGRIGADCQEERDDERGRG